MNPAQKTMYLQEIDTICASASFRRSPTMRKLLRYLTAEALAGRGAELNQYLIATDGMGLGEGFDQTKNSSVRVWGVRLRALLEAYYETDGQSHPVRVLLPERSFCPAFEQASPLQEVRVGGGQLPTMAVVEFRGLGLSGAWKVFPALLAENLVANLAAFPSIEAVGPFERRLLTEKGLTPAELGARHGIQFILDGSVHKDAQGVVIRAHLLRGSNGAVCWSEVFELPIASNAIPRGDLAVARKLASFVGDDYGAVRREILRTTIGRPVESLSTQEALLWAWQAYSTMAPRDVFHARDALQHALSVDAQPIVKAFAAMNLLHVWTITLAKDPPLPERSLELIEEVQAEDPANPWLGMMGVYLHMLRGEASEAEQLCLDLFSRPIPTFVRILLVGICMRAGLGCPENAWREWRHCLAANPYPPAWSFIAPATTLIVERRYREALECLEQGSTPEWYFNHLLPAAALVGKGDVAGARRELALLRRKFPRFQELGRAIFTRLFAQEVWETLAHLLRPLAPELFPESAKLPVKSPLNAPAKLPRRKEACTKTNAKAQLFAAA